MRIVMMRKYAKNVRVCSMYCVNYPAAVFCQLLVWERQRVVAAGKIRRVFVVIRMWVLMQGKRMQMGCRQDAEGMAQLAYVEVQ